MGFSWKAAARKQNTATEKHPARSKPSSTRTHVALWDKDLYSVLLWKPPVVKPHSASVHSSVCSGSGWNCFLCILGAERQWLSRGQSQEREGLLTSAYWCGHSFSGWIRKRTNHRIKWEHWNFYLLPLGTTSLTLIGKTSEWAAVHCIQTCVSRAPKMELDLLLNPTVSTLAWTCCILYCP